jgi:hypothetical protein
MSEDIKNIEKTQQPINDGQQASKKETNDQIPSSTVSLSKEKNNDQQKEAPNNMNKSSTLKNSNQDDKEKIESHSETTKLPDVIYIQRNYNKYSNSDHFRPRTPPIYFDENFPSILERRVNSTNSNPLGNILYLFLIEVTLYLGCHKN